MRVFRLELGARRASNTFTVLFALCAIEAFLVGLRFGYRIDALIGIQRMLPLFLGPLMFLGFQSLTVTSRQYGRVLLLHLGAPIVGMFAFLALVENLRLDWMISASYLIYLGALGWLWKNGSDRLIYARVEVSQGLANWMLRAIGLLFFVLLLDTTIAIDFAVNSGTNVAALISYGTLPIIVVLLTVILTFPSIVPTAMSNAATPSLSGHQDNGIAEKLHDLMLTEQLFLDPDLTVQRLAKRIHLPARQVSGAVNRTRGMNVSQYVN